MALHLPSGASNYLEIINSPSLANTRSDEIFISAYVKTSGSKMIVSNCTSSYCAYSLMASDTSKRVYFNVGNSWTSTGSGLFNWIQGDWNHITARYFQQPYPLNGTIEICVNGLLVKQTTGLSRVIQPTGNLYIGMNSKYYGGYTSEATIDEVYVSDDGTFLRDESNPGKDLLNVSWNSVLYLPFNGDNNDESG